MAFEQTAVHESLIPTTPVQTRRYDTEKSRSSPQYMTIPGGPPSLNGLYSSPLPPTSWSCHIQPEGKPYFTRADFPRTVTDVYMPNQHAQCRIMRFTAAVCKELQERNIVLPESSELFLSPSDDDENACKYYFVDHEARTVWWLGDHDSDELLPEPVVSLSHLQYMLHEQYWGHTEQFPSHRAERLRLDIDELIGILLHGENDQRTSMGSTFPYPPEQCEAFVRILQNIKSDPHRPTAVCTVARLWAAICRQRYQTFYSQERPRLDRGQRVVARDDEPERGALYAGLSRVLFNVPAEYAQQLDSVWCDGLVYTFVWKEFLHKIVEDWRQHFTWSLGLAAVNILLCLTSDVSRPLAVASLITCALAAAAALALLTQHQNKCVRSCNDAVPFCWWAAQDGNVRASLIFSMPRALFLWAAALTIMQLPVWLERTMGPYILAGVGVFVLGASLPWARWTRSAAEWRRARFCGEGDESVYEKV